MTRNVLAGTVLLAALAVCAPARAGWGIVDFEIGAKGGAGGGLWTEPSRLPFYLGGQDWAFSQQRGGWGGGAGLYAQLRILKAIGLEVDALVDQQLIRETPLSGYSWRLYAKSLNMRFPVLVQAILPLPGIRIGLGIGPEFVVPMKSTAQQTNPPMNYAGYPFKVDAKTSTMLTMGINITPTLGHLSIPVDLRASYNLTQPKNFEGRVTVNENALGQKDVSKGFTIHYEDTWDFRLLVGLGYAF